MCYSAMVRQDLKTLEQEFGASTEAPLWTLLEKLTRQDPKKFRIPGENGRFFPNYYVPTVAYHHDDDARKIVPMRYSAFPPTYLDASSAMKLTTYNARLDSLGKRFWSESFMHFHGIVVIRGFYEWVSVSDLVKGGSVTLAEVKADFEKKLAEREAKANAAGKKFTATKADRQDPLTRKVIIEFQPETGKDLIIPIIYSKDPEREFSGFAMVTTNPTQDIERGGHDRMPCILEASSVDAWLHCASKSPEEHLRLLDRVYEGKFSHRLDTSA